MKNLVIGIKPSHFILKSIAEKKEYRITVAERDAVVEAQGRGVNSITISRLYVTFPSSGISMTPVFSSPNGPMRFQIKTKILDGEMTVEEAEEKYPDLIFDWIDTTPELTSGVEEGEFIES